MQDTPLLVTAERASELTQLGRSTIYQLLKSGELQSVKIGRSRRIPRKALEDFVAGLREEQQQPAGHRGGTRARS
jgi:excisionase family DNA binding protein